ncbi:MAG: hypothetical protein IT376_20565 [Polyangiaceae bacterium]|nr:hypothetical protein [Polyangiaceae bacterium]
MTDEPAPPPAPSLAPPAEATASGGAPAGAALPLALRVGVGLVAGCVVATEILLTRLFSVAVWYHFAFFAISLALLGTGAAGFGVHVAQRRLERAASATLLAVGALVLAVAIAAVALVLLGTSPDWFGVGFDPFTRPTARLALVFAAATAPFAAGGFALAVAFARYSGDAPLLYSWDLAGAAAACALVVPALAVAGAPVALVGVAVVAAAAALLLARASPSRRVLTPVAAVTGVALAALAALGPPAGLLRVQHAKGIDLKLVPPELMRWNSFSLVTVLPGMGFKGWGLSPRYHGPFPEQKTLVIDMNAMTTLTRLRSLEDARFASHDLSALAYRLRPGVERACVIGAGGGKDVLAALASGARHVTGAEVNPLIVEEVMRGQYRDFTGGLYARDDVTIVVEDGRAFARRTTDRFDVLLLSMVDTSASTAAGAYALTENSLYTREAFVDFLSRLAPGGVLSVSSASLADLAVGARLTSLARAAVVARGGDPARAIAVVQTPWVGLPGSVLSNVLVKPDGFTEAEVASLERIAAELDFHAAYLPGRAIPPRWLENGVISRIATDRDGAGLAAWLATLPLDVSPTTDDRPFFFYQNRIAHLPIALALGGAAHMFGNGLVVLSKVAVLALLAVLLLLGLPLVLAGGRAHRARGGLPSDLTLVSLLGVSFMLVEIALIQRLSVFLGHPTSTLSVVLLVLLLGGAAGARWIAPRGVRAVQLALGLAGAQALLLAVFAGPLLASGGALPFAGRAAISGILVAPLGLVLGAPFPAVLAAVARRAPERLPWLWAVNAGTGVLGSVLATLISLHAGIGATLVAGAVGYLGGLTLSRRVLTRP